MNIVKSSFRVITPITNGAISELQRIELPTRLCYKSENKITPDGESAKKILKTLIDNDHLAMLEHSSITVIFVTSRGVSHELVRHRIASYAQESTRYCNYSNEKFTNQLTFIDPLEEIEWDSKMGNLSAKEKLDTALQMTMFYKKTEIEYLELIKKGVPPQIAREILPNGLKTEIALTCNYRKLIAIFKLRCAKNAHPAMRALMVPFAKYMQEQIPDIFGNIEV